MLGDLPYLSPEVEEFAKKEQAARTPEHSWTGIIDEWLNHETVTIVGKDKDGVVVEHEGKRDITCIMQVWTECINKNNENAKGITRSATMQIGKIIDSLPGWKRGGDKRRRIPGYGSAAFFYREGTLVL